MDRFLQLHCFARVAETGSFSAVGRELGLGQPNVSRYVAALEQSLGTRLMRRSTRKLTLTPEGERYYADVRAVLDALQEADSQVRGEGKPSGLLRVSCPTSLGVGIVLPRMKRFMQLYPDIDLDLRVLDRYADFIEEGIDLAIRIGPLEDNTLRARRIGSSARICVASVEYVAEYGEPRAPQELAQHNCILYSALAAGNSWPFREDHVTTQGRLRVNTMDGVYRAVLDGFGIGYGPIWLFEKPILEGRVQILLHDYSAPAAPINLVYAAKRLLSSRTIAFMDYVANEFTAIPALNEGALAGLLRESIRAR